MSGEGPKEIWKQEVIKDLDVLRQIPPEYLHKGPNFDITTKTGGKLLCETYCLDLDECVRAGIGDFIKNVFVGGKRSFLVAKDESGTVVGTRISSLFPTKLDGEAALAVQSYIKILQKGEGLARSVEEAFQQLLQFYANEASLPVVWKVENQNLFNLERYKEREDKDPNVLATMEAEQNRWKALYGDGGKLGIMNGKKVFMPKH